MTRVWINVSFAIGCIIGAAANLWYWPNPINVFCGGVAVAGFTYTAIDAIFGNRYMTIIKQQQELIGMMLIDLKAAASQQHIIQSPPLDPDDRPVIH